MYDYDKIFSELFFTLTVIANQQQQHYAPMISTPIIPRQPQPQQRHFLPVAPYFPHSTVNNNPTTPASTLPTTPYTISKNYQQQHQQYLGNPLDTTFTVANGNNNNNTNKTKANDIHTHEDYDSNEVRYPASSDFPDFSMDSLVQPTTFNMNQTVEGSVHDTSTPLLNSEYPPPDLISNNFEFTRTMRKWVSAKEKDDDFFEEEQRYLKSLQTKRLK